MKAHDFTCSITAPVTADEAMSAISHVELWWTKNFKGSAKNLNDVFTVTFGETFVDFRIAELIPDAKVVWAVTDCNLHWQNNKTEWNGTKVIYELSSAGGETTINFTHQGLQPQVECYANCSKGWTEHITESLLKLLTEGVGEPI